MAQNDELNNGNMNVHRLVLLVGYHFTDRLQMVSAAKGRFDYFELMIVYTAELEKVDVRILVYRSKRLKKKGHPNLI